MKKIILGLVIGLMFGGVAHAWSQKQEAQPIFGFDCSGPYYETNDHMYYADKNGKKLSGDQSPIADPTGTNGKCSGTVYVFDNDDNKCYVVKGSNASGISCVKQ